MRSWRYYVALGGTAMVLFTLLRLLFFYTNNHELIRTPQWQTLFLGLRFDGIVTCGWIVLLLILELLPKSNIVQRAAHVFTLVPLWIMAGIGFTDIAWYKHFSHHLSRSALDYGQSPLEAGTMVFKTPYMLGYLALWLSTMVVLFVVVSFIRKRFESAPERRLNRQRAVLGLFCVIGIRGSFGFKPLKPEDQQHHKVHFFNETACNPLYNLLVAPLYGYDLPKPSVEQWRQYSHYLSQDGLHRNKPILDKGILAGRNVVLVIMEGMPKCSVSPQTTPFLHSMETRSLVFDSMMSCGEHTHNGIFSILTGLPGTSGTHMLRSAEYAPVKGIPGHLREQGYTNTYFIPHRRQFDNMGPFLWRHYFQSVKDIANIPQRLQGGNSWGVCDHRFYQYVLATTQKQQAPFLLVLNSISNHEPFEIPADAPKPNPQKTALQNMANYADWSLKQFFKEAAKQPWYNNTVFIMVSDHGMNVQHETAAIPMNLHHVPAYIFAPGSNLQGKHIRGLASQTDLLPTLLWLMNIELREQAEGINLLTHERPFVGIYSDVWTGVYNGKAAMYQNRFGQQQTMAQKPEDAAVMKSIYPMVTGANAYLMGKTIHGLKN